MKHLCLVMMIFLLSACQMIYRDFQDDELSKMAINDFNFSSFSCFKIVDQETALYLTGQTYTNSGVVLGVKDQTYQMIFVPKTLKDDPIYLPHIPDYDLDYLYRVLENFVADSIFLSDYGGLSVSVQPYEHLSASDKASLTHPLFFRVTTDQDIFYGHFESNDLIIFNSSYEKIFTSIE